MAVIPKHTREQIVNAYCRGRGIRRCARHYKVATITVANILNEYHVVRRNPLFESYIPTQEEIKQQTAKILANCSESELRIRAGMKPPGWKPPTVDTKYVFQHYF